MRPFSIYFPQFYPTPTNDRVWGKGFTDWALLANANVRLPDSQRRAPARGLYDGADPAVHTAQIGEMVASGLGGIALYHYWFYTHQELSAFEDTLRSGTPGTEMPWFLIWATEGWTKRWLGDHTTIVDLDRDPSDVLIEAHCRHLAACFANPNYYRWRGRPLFVWYNLGHFGRPAYVVQKYRTVLHRLGFDIAMASFVKSAADVALCAETDATYIFEPRLFFNMGRRDRGPGAKRVFSAAASLIGHDNANKLLVSAEQMSRGKGRVFDADSFMDHMRSRERAELLAQVGHDRQEVLSPGWDNRPRYQGRQFTALENLPTEQFGLLLANAMRSGTLPPLINAWNEWTEKAAIEPCSYLGSRYLTEVQRVVASMAANDKKTSFDATPTLV